MGEFFSVSQADTVVVLGTGAAANLVCPRWLARHNRILEKRGIQRASTCFSNARFRFGGWRLGEVRHAADSPAAVAGNRGKLSASALDAGIPALFRKGAMGAPGRQLEFLRGSLVLRRQGVKIP